MIEETSGIGQQQIRPDIARQGLISGAGVGSDPWSMRNKSMKCSTCIWFVSKEPQATTVTVKSHQVGRCRRHAPTMGGYPVVYMTDWCGDHKVDENKL